MKPTTGTFEKRWPKTLLVLIVYAISWTTLTHADPASDKVLEILGKEIRGDFSEHRSRSADEISQLGLGAIPALLAVLRESTDSRTLSIVSEALTRYQNNTGDFLPDIVQILDFENEKVLNYFALHIIAEVGTMVAEQPCVDVLQSDRSDNVEKIKAAKALLRFGSEASRQLVTDSMFTSEFATKMLHWEHRSAGITPTYVDLLYDADNEAAQRQLVKFYLHGAEMGPAYEYIGRVNEISQPIPEVVETLFQVLTDLNEFHQHRIVAGEKLILFRQEGLAAIDAVRLRNAVYEMYEVQGYKSALFPGSPFEERLVELARAVGLDV